MISSPRLFQKQHRVTRVWYSLMFAVLFKGLRDMLTVGHLPGRWCCCVGESKPGGIFCLNDLSQHTERAFLSCKELFCEEGGALTRWHISALEKEMDPSRRLLSAYLLHLQLFMGKAQQNSQSAILSYFEMVELKERNPSTTSAEIKTRPNDWQSFTWNNFLIKKR